MTTSGWTLAIDFGTCFTCAAMRTGDRVEVVETDNGRYLPSLVYRDEDGELLTGRRAASRAMTFPGRVARTPKRELANRSRLLLGGVAVEAEDLAAAVLSTIAGEAVHRAGGTQPEEVVLSHPVAWDTDQIAALGEAAARANLTSVRFVPEPIAAAAFYAHQDDLPIGALVAVYDLGGGTFDVAVLRRTASGFDVVAQGGSDRIGGEDFDDALYELVADHAVTLDADAWRDFMEATGPRADRDRALLRREVTEAKELLSVELTRTILAGDQTIRITRDELNKAIEANVQDTILAFQDVLGGAGLSTSDLTAVYLTGGSSRVPLVGDLLAQYLGRSPGLAADPKAVVALGALRWAARPQAASAESAEPTNTDTGQAGTGPGSHMDGPGKSAKPENTGTERNGARPDDHTDDPGEAAEPKGTGAGQAGARPGDHVTDPGEKPKAGHAHARRAGGRPIARGSVLPRTGNEVTVLPGVPYFHEPQPDARGVALGNSPRTQLATLALTGIIDAASKDRQLRQAFEDAQKTFDQFLTQMAYFCLGETYTGSALIRERLEEQHEMWRPLLRRRAAAGHIQEIRSVAEAIVESVRENYRILPPPPRIKPINSWTGMWLATKVRNRRSACTAYLEGLAAFAEPPVDVADLRTAMPQLREPLAQASETLGALATVVGAKTPLAQRVEQLNVHLERLGQAIDAMDAKVRAAVGEGAL